MSSARILLKRRHSRASVVDKISHIITAFLLVSAATLIEVGIAHAEYPERIIRIVVPFAPGGGTDLVARTLAEAMASDLGQNVIIENKPGAGTIVGTSAVASSARDGYTLLVATFAHAVNPSLNEKLPYDTAKAFAPIGLVAKSFNLAVVPSSSAFKSIADLIAFGKAHPGKLNYGSFGIGTSAHLAGELFKHLAKVDLTHVPYRGAAPAITDLLGGRIDVMFTTVASVVSHIQAGSVRALAVTSAERVPAFKDIPTMAEAGVPGYVADSWYGLYAPAGTPAPIIKRLNAAIARAVQSDAFKKVQDVEGLILVSGTPEDLDNYVRGEEARWRSVIQSANIKP